jgi:hypothetical protein
VAQQSPGAASVVRRGFRMRMMHAVILGVGLGTAAAALWAAPAADCPPRRAALAEHFIRADCADCWRQRADAADAAPQWRFDWIVPALDAVDAPLAAAALPEAAERSVRAAAAPALPMRTAVGRLAPPRGARLTVSAGPAWHGYIGVQVDASGSWPKGSSVWLALVEQLPAGSEGSPAPRALVRSVAGPLPLPPSRSGFAQGHLHAMRWPEAAQPERLQPRGWIEAADGRILAVASPQCPLR